MTDQTNVVMSWKRSEELDTAKKMELLDKVTAAFNEAGVTDAQVHMEVQ